MLPPHAADDLTEFATQMSTRAGARGTDAVLRPSAPEGSKLTPFDALILRVDRPASLC